MYARSVIWEISLVVSWLASDVPGADSRAWLCGWYPEVFKVTLKGNGYEALSDEFLFKSNSDEALNDVFL